MTSEKSRCRFVAWVVRFARDESAPSMAEYGLSLVFTALVLAAGAFALTGGIGSLMQSTAPAIGNHAPPP